MIFIVFVENNRVFVGRRYFLSRDFVVVGKTVFCGASLLTLLAIDALGRIVENSFAHELFSWAATGAGSCASWSQIAQAAQSDLGR